MKAENKSQFVKEWQSHVRDIFVILNNFEGSEFIVQYEKFTNIERELNEIIELAAEKSGLPTFV